MQWTEYALNMYIWYTLTKHFLATPHTVEKRETSVYGDGGNFFNMSTLLIWQNEYSICDKSQTNNITRNMGPKVVT